MPDSEVRYCCIGVHYADNPDAPEFLAVEGKVVLFDTLAIAQEILPRLGGSGRTGHWQRNQETLCFTPLSVRGYNRLSIWTGYDPYDVPTGFRAKGVWSEAKGRDWKRHVYWRHVLDTLLQWAETTNQEALPDYVGAEA